MKRIVFAALLAVMSMPAFAAQAAKDDICHFDLDYGVWKLISISGNAVDEHLNNHDDGLPNGETGGTNTQLDETCAPIPTCPCWDDETVEELAAEISDWEAEVPYPEVLICERTTNVNYDEVEIRMAGYTDAGKSNTVNFRFWAKVNTGRRQGDCEIDTDVPIFYTAQTGTASTDLDWARVCVAELDEVRQDVTFCP